VHTDTASGDAPDAAHHGGILEAPAEKSFDRMLRLAEMALCTPIVLMSFGGGIINGSDQASDVAL
jgi:hypothetical protein